MTEHLETSFRTDIVDHRCRVPLAVGPVAWSSCLVALLLEDEPLIAMDVETALQEAGFEVVTLMSCEAAHAWPDRLVPDVVIVDIELRDGRCTDFVSRLVKANIFFVVHSGQHAGTFADSPFSSGTWVGKPSNPKDLVNAARVAAMGLLLQAPNSPAAS